MTRGRYVTKADAIADLHRVAELLGRTPTIAEYTLHGDYSATPHQDRFGSWTDALEAAGLEPGFRPGGQPIPDEDLLDDLRRVADDLGEAPYTVQYEEHGTHSPSTFLRRFGSWREAVEAAGLEYRERTRPDRFNLGDMDPEDLGLSPIDERA